MVLSIRISGESNRVPFDPAEAEPESVAGFITEYSSIYFPLTPSTEYASIIAIPIVYFTVLSLYHSEEEPCYLYDILPLTTIPY